jgi:hypothetical protein
LRPFFVVKADGYALLMFNEDVVELELTVSSISIFIGFKDAIIEARSNWRYFTVRCHWLISKFVTSLFA